MTAPQSSQEKENQEYNYELMSTSKEEQPNPNERGTQGESVNGSGEFTSGRQLGVGILNFDEVIGAMHNEVN